jgi:hypothetical protein
MSDQPLTEDDYQFDTATLMRSMGIDPATVREGSVRLQFLDGKAVLTYEVMKAVPARLLAASFLNASGLAVKQSDPQGLRAVEEEQ